MGISGSNLQKKGCFINNIETSPMNNIIPSGRSPVPGKVVNHSHIYLAQKATKLQQNIASLDTQLETGIV
jgi:hypothetical protein